MKFIFEFLFILIIAMIADLQARMIGDGKTIHHGWWDLLFGALILGAWQLEGRPWLFLIALVLEHFVFFPPTLNLMRSPRESFFYLSAMPHKGSIWDWFMLKIGPAYPFVWVAGLAGFTIIQIIIL